MRRLIDRLLSLEGRATLGTAWVLIGLFQGVKVYLIYISSIHLLRVLCLLPLETVSTGQVTQAWKKKIFAKLSKLRTLAMLTDDLSQHFGKMIRRKNHHEAYSHNPWTVYLLIQSRTERKENSTVIPWSLIAAKDSQKKHFDGFVCIHRTEVTFAVLKVTNEQPESLLNRDSCPFDL